MPFSPRLSFFGSLVREIFSRTSFNFYNLEKNERNLRHLSRITAFVSEDTKEEVVEKN